MARSIPLPILLTLLAACSSAKIIDAKNMKQQESSNALISSPDTKASPSSDSKDAEAKGQSPYSGASNKEAEGVTRPVKVTGAYLRCSPILEYQSDLEIGCLFADGNGNHISSAALAVDVRYSFEAPSVPADSVRLVRYNLPDRLYDAGLIVTSGSIAKSRSFVRSIEVSATLISPLENEGQNEVSLKSKVSEVMAPANASGPILQVLSVPIAPAGTQTKVVDRISGRTWFRPVNGADGTWSAVNTSCKTSIFGVASALPNADEVDQLIRHDLTANTAAQAALSIITDTTIWGESNDALTAKSYMFTLLPGDSYYWGDLVKTDHMLMPLCTLSSL